jgi:hypothetical protein
MMFAALILALPAGLSMPGQRAHASPLQSFRSLPCLKTTTDRMQSGGKPLKLASKSKVCVVNYEGVGPLNVTEEGHPLNSPSFVAPPHFKISWTWTGCKRGEGFAITLIGFDGHKPYNNPELHDIDTGEMILEDSPYDNSGKGSRSFRLRSSHRYAFDLNPNESASSAACRWTIEVSKTR